MLALHEGLQGSQSTVAPSESQAAPIAYQQNLQHAGVLSSLAGETRRRFSHDQRTEREAGGFAIRFFVEGRGRRGKDKYNVGVRIHGSFRFSCYY